MNNQQLSRGKKCDVSCTFHIKSDSNLGQRKTKAVGLSKQTMKVLHKGFRKLYKKHKKYLLSNIENGPS